MSGGPLIKELYAPDQVRSQSKNPTTWADVYQYGVLITCIFLNRTRARYAKPYIRAFLQAYPTPESLQDIRPEDILRDYFQKLGFHRRAWTVVALARQLRDDPPRPGVLRRKTDENAGYASEVAHLVGIGDYGSDAWRLFCRVDFYAGHGITVADEWDRVNLKDKDLQRYVQRKRREHVQRNINEEAESLISQLHDLRIFGEGVMVGEQKHRMFVPRRIIDSASNFQLAKA
jgi:endonuclease III